MDEWRLTLYLTGFTVLDDVNHALVRVQEEIDRAFGESVGFDGTTKLDFDVSFGSGKIDLSIRLEPKGE